MGEINLFEVDGKNISEIDTKTVNLEKKIQTLIEQNLEELLGRSYLVLLFLKVNILQEKNMEVE